MSQSDNAVSVPVNGQKQIVYAIPAKPKPRASWLKRNWGGVLLIWSYFMLAAYIWFNP